MWYTEALFAVLKTAVDKQQHRQLQVNIRKLIRETYREHFNSGDENDDGSYVESEHAVSIKLLSISYLVAALRHPHTEKTKLSLSAVMTYLNSAIYSAEAMTFDNPAAIETYVFYDKKAHRIQLPHPDAVVKTKSSSYLVFSDKGRKRYQKRKTAMQMRTHFKTSNVVFAIDYLQGDTNFRFATFTQAMLEVLAQNFTSNIALNTTIIESINTDIKTNLSNDDFPTAELTKLVALMGALNSLASSNLTQATELSNYLINLDSKLIGNVKASPDEQWHAIFELFSSRLKDKSIDPDAIIADANKYLENVVAVAHSMPACGM